MASAVNGRPTLDLQNTTMFSFVDDNGSPVLNIAQQPILRPLGADPHFFTLAGKLAGDVDPIEAIMELENFEQGGPWDVQRWPGADTAQAADSANVNIALFASAAGLPKATLNLIANAYAGTNSNFGTATMDDTYTNLRAGIVHDYSIGYSLQTSGAISTLTGYPRF